VKKSLSDKDIKKISDKQRRKQKKRELFESRIETYIKTDCEYLTYAILFPQWHASSSKSQSYYLLRYYLVYPDLVTASEEIAIVKRGDLRFSKYQDFKKFLKNNGELREVTEFEKAMLEGSKEYISQFKDIDVETDVEFLEPLEEIGELGELKEIGNLEELGELEEIEEDYNNFDDKFVNYNSYDSNRESSCQILQFKRKKIKGCII